MGAGDAKVAGGAGDDLLDGGRGDDRLTGGSGDDTFVFKAHGGDDVVTDFTAGGTDDQLDLHATTHDFTTFADVLGHAHQVGTSTVIDLGGGDSVTLLHVHKAALTTDDFIL